MSAAISHGVVPIDEVRAVRDAEKRAVVAFAASGHSARQIAAKTGATIEAVSAILATRKRK